jgi:hypothetical protein
MRTNIVTPGKCDAAIRRPYAQSPAVAELGD